MRDTVRPVHHAAAKLLLSGAHPDGVAARLRLDSTDVATAQRLARTVRPPIVPPREIAATAPADDEPLPEPGPKRKRAAGTPVDSDRIGDLLAWADQDGDQRARALAARIRAAVGDLAAVRDRCSQEGKARRAADVAAARLARAKQRLAVVVHGTKHAVAAHHRAQDPLCGECALWAQAHARRPGTPDRCGTRAGRQAHYDHGEPVCARCREADREYQEDRKAVAA
jgi:hypothetical protein